LVNPIILTAATNHCQFSQMFSDATAIGNCITQNVTFGVPEFIAFALLAFMVYVIAKEGLPAGVVIPSSLLLFYSFNLMIPSPIFFGFFVLSAIIGGIVIGGGVLRFISRRGQ